MTRVLALIIFVGGIASCGFSPKPASNQIKDVEDVESMVKRSDGRFDVRCSNGDKEIATAQDIKDGNVCRAQSGEQLVCAKVSDRWFIAVRTSSGYKYPGAGYAYESGCRRSLEKAANGLFCTQSSSGFVLVSATTGDVLSGEINYESSCYRSVDSSANGLVCAQFDTWIPTIIRSGTKLGSGLGYESTCRNVISDVVNGLVCTLSASKWAPFEIDTGYKVGDGYDYESSCRSSREN